MQTIWVFFELVKIYFSIVIWIRCEFFRSYFVHWFNVIEIPIRRKQWKNVQKKTYTYKKKYAFRISRANFNFAKMLIQNVRIQIGGIWMTWPSTKVHVDELNLSNNEKKTCKKEEENKKNASFHYQNIYIAHL